jgi:hypothetical protein
MNRSVILYMMNEASIKNYFNKVGKTIVQQHSNRIKNTLDKYPIVKKQISNVVKHGKQHIPRIAKVAWKQSTPKQKKSLLGASTGRILKTIATRIIGGPVGTLATSISSQLMSKRPREEI